MDHNFRCILGKCAPVSEIVSCDVLQMNFLITALTTLKRVRKRHFERNYIRRFILKEIIRSWVFFEVREIQSKLYRMQEIDIHIKNRTL